MADATITVYYRTRGEWMRRLWMTLSRLPGIGPRRRLRFVSNAIAATRLEMRVGRYGRWTIEPPGASAAPG